MNSYFYEIEAATRSRAWRREAAINRALRRARREQRQSQARKEVMPLFMDVHNQLPDGATATDVARAHEADVAIQERFGVNYRQYWISPQDGKVFCLVTAPNKEAAAAVHREAHGLVADLLYEVVEG
ncbi:MAG TPA: DUF4242 domain-containing protein [Acidimicrobiia bacterium]|jgi:hypothetical protein